MPQSVSRIICRRFRRGFLVNRKFSCGNVGFYVDRRRFASLVKFRKSATNLSACKELSARIVPDFSRRYSSKRYNFDDDDGDSWFSKIVRFVPWCLGILTVGCFYYFTREETDPIIETVGEHEEEFEVDNRTINLNDVVANNKFNFIADVVKTAIPAVVRVEVRSNSDIRQFMGISANSYNGSGFIVRKDGLVLTNAHVVMSNPNGKYFIKLYNGKTFEGVLESLDMKHDLATLKIQADNLTVMKLGSSQNLVPGEWVVAIGSPYSLSNTVTTGVVSSATRPSAELGLAERNMQYIQTDAAITFGNSGGPLVNLDGEAVGINAMKVTSGISFAIPIEYAKDFLEKAARGVESVSVKRKYLGIGMLSLNADLGQEVGQRVTGVLVQRVFRGSPAEAIGLIPGDVISHINGAEMRGTASVYKALESSGPLQLNVIRGQLRFSVIVQPTDKLPCGCVS